jgi:hypothetical protein
MSSRDQTTNPVFTNFVHTPICSVSAVEKENKFELVDKFFFVQQGFFFQL